jgi:hypothetical protein
MHTYENYLFLLDIPTHILDLSLEASTSSHSQAS